MDQPHTWDWTSPPVSSFQVHGTAQDRVVMVLVCPDATAAQAALLRTEARERALNPAHPLTGEAGPLLVIGYGPSMWSGNVALVRTTQTQLERIYQSQIDRDSGLYVDPGLVQGPSQSTSVVDLDFQHALQNRVVNL